MRILRRISNVGYAEWNSETDIAYTDSDGFYRLARLRSGEYRIGTTFFYNTEPLSEPDPIRSGSVVDDSRQWVLQNDARTPRPPSSPDGAARWYSNVFYPSALDLPKAQTIALAPGEQRDDVNLILTAGTGHRVTGMVRGPDGPLKWPRLLLFNGDWTPSSQPSYSAAARPDGEFTFMAVTPGTYTLVARVSILMEYQPDPDGVFARQTVIVGDADVEHLSVNMQPGHTVRGRFRFVGTQPLTAPPPAGLKVTMEVPGTDYFTRGAGPPPGTFAMTSATEFVTTGVQEEKFFVLASGPEGWTVESALIGGRDATIVPVEVDRDMNDLVVTMTNQPTTISGTVVDDHARAQMDGAVIVFTPDTTLWSSGRSWSRVVQVRWLQAGRYKTSELAPGSYYVAFAPQGSVDQYPSPDQLRALMKTAQLYTVGAGQQITANLVVR